MREQIVAEARSWIGTPFVHQADRKGIGCDCIGLVRGVAIATGIFPPDVLREPVLKPYLNYGRFPDGRLIPACREFLTQISFAEVQPGDILIFRVFDKHAQHAGIVTETEPLKMVHSYSRTRVMACIEQLVDAFWRGRIVGVFRYRGVE